MGWLRMPGSCCSGAQAPGPGAGEREGEAEGEACAETEGAPVAEPVCEGVCEGVGVGLVEARLLGVCEGLRLGVGDALGEGSVEGGAAARDATKDMSVTCGKPALALSGAAQAPVCALCSARPTEVKFQPPEGAAAAAAATLPNAQTVLVENSLAESTSA